MKALVILNPPADESGKKTVLESLARHFDAVPIEYEVVEAGLRDQATGIARRGVLAGVDLVVAAGGDGTASAVAEALVGTSVPLAIIPTGTGNLLARELGIPGDVDAAVALIASSPRTRRIDVMRIGRRAFLLNAGVGINASVIGGTTRWSKRRFGRIAYIRTALAAVFSARPRHLVIEVDGVAHPYRAVDVVIMNCGLLSRMFYPKGPVICIDDGRLGVWVLSMKTIGDYARYVAGVLSGRALHPGARFIRATGTVAIRSGIPMPVQADGDMIGTTPVSVEILPGALAVLVAPEPAAPCPVVAD